MCIRDRVLLAWNLPEGWNPTDFIVYYTDADSETVTLRTGGEMNCTVDGLVNGMQYTNDYGGMFAAVVIVFAPTFLLYIFLSDKIIAGVTGGAIKG